MNQGFTREQLDALRRQIEEDYRLDVAAIERLQRRFLPASAPAPAPANNYPPANMGNTIETLGTPLPPKMEVNRDPQNDELTGSLRAMFSSQRK